MNQASPSLGGGHGLSLSVRDLLSWAGFITSSMSELGRDVYYGSKASPSSTNVAVEKSALRPWEAYAHGAALVLLDGMGLGAGLSPLSVDRLRKSCAKILKEQVRF